MSAETNSHASGIVAIIGPPNAGKSTLLNCFLGHKLAIVTPKPQTTRNQISGILSEPDMQIVFLDTPGIHRPASDMNSLLVKVAWQALNAADAILLVLDAHLGRTKPQRFQAELDLLQSRLQSIPLPLVVTLNKVDRIRRKDALLPLMHSLQATFPQAETVPISATRQDNTHNLLSVLSQHLPPGPPLYPEDQLSTLPLRFLSSEVIREKLFLHLQRELPYSTAVAIELWDENLERGLTTIQAVIYVPKQSHKGIVIGRKGALLKEIGQAARLELEELLQMQVNLQLWVKVKPKWTEDQSFVLQFLPELSP